MDPMQRIGDEPFLLPYMEYNSANYDLYLDEKREIMDGHFTELLNKSTEVDCPKYNIDIISSPTTHSRQKCRFGIGRDDRSEYNGLVHMMWKFGGGPVIVVDAFPIASKPIYNMMPILLSVIQSKAEYECMVAHFTSVSYLSTLSEHLLITMVYDRSDDDITDSATPFCTEDVWRSAAEKVLAELKERNVPNVSKLSIIGRWKGVKIIVGQDYVYETLHLSDGRSLTYKQVEEGFSNPNSSVSCKALDWLCGIARIIVQENEAENEGKAMDLLEMYCGNGNHTCALAAYFSRILAVEINPNLCAAAEENFKLNGIANAHVLVCDSAKFANQVLRTKKYAIYATTEPQQIATDELKEETTTEPANLSTRSKKKHAAAVRHAQRSAESKGEGTAGVVRPEKTACGTVHSEDVVNTEGLFSTDDSASPTDTEIDEAATSTFHACSLSTPIPTQVPTPIAPPAVVPRVPLYEFRFGAVLVDPPRCGLDKLTLSLVAGYAHILYISCSPESLMRDLNALLRTHTLRRVALFDQFAYTPHIETGVWLQIKK